MPRARTDDWQAHPPPQTPLQRNAFLDVCTEWLIRPPKPEDDDVSYEDFSTPAVTSFVAPSTAPAAPPPDGMGVTVVAYTRGEFRTRASHAMCALCGNPADRTVVGNPFAQRHLVAVCSTHAL